MAEQPAILAIDQGTTSSRAIVFDAQGAITAMAQEEFEQHYPADGWVEHDPEEIWSSTLSVSRAAMQEAEAKGLHVVAIGITNQRETVVAWDRKTGKPIYNAIVWQDRRTAKRCAELRDAGKESEVTARTGLLIDPYFSGTKAEWLLHHVELARGKAEQGELAIGTIDAFLLWRLTGGEVFATDATNAARTLLYNIHENRWDAEMLGLFGIPEVALPDVRDCAADFGSTDPDLFGRSIPICGIAGDQQAAAIGQACFSPGTIKSTYGTGCFVILNTGPAAVASKNRLLTTICYRLNGETTYAIEGSIFIAGAAVQWLRDGLKAIRTAAETEGLARGLPDNRGVYMVPAFTGLGAPYWDANARGAVFGITRDTGPAEFARAALESVGYQTRDLFDAMAQDGVTPTELRVDGGMVANDWVVQFLADVLGIPVDRPEITETTALGAAFLAGLQCGVCSSLDDVTNLWRVERRFAPGIDAGHREHLISGWRRAVGRVQDMEQI